MPPSSFRCNRTLDSLVEIAAPHYRQNRHQVFVQHKPVRRRDFNDNRNRIGRRGDARRGENVLSILADVILVCLPVLRNSSLQRIALTRAEEVAAVPRELANRLIGDRFHDKEGFLTDAEQVVVKTGAGDDVLRRLRDIRSFVNNRRRIAGTGGDCLFPTGECRPDNTPTAGCYQHSDIRMLHQLFRRAEARVGNRSQEIRRPTCLHDCLIDDMHRFFGAFARVRMRTKHDGIARRKHDNRVVNHRRSRIRGRRNRIDNAERDILHQQRAGVPCHRLRVQVLNPR